MTLFRIIAAIVAIAMAAVIVWAGWGRQANLFEEGGAIAAMPWGVVTLVDLYAGFLLFAGVILLFERNKLVGLAWALPVFFLGNVWTGVWAVLRARELARRLKA
ncbi:MAG: hypothetical protein AAF719_11300 [Pseudomonadota bacterium]